MMNFAVMVLTHRSLLIRHSRYWLNHNAKLNKMINSCRQHDKLLDIYNKNSHAFDYINYNTMLKQLLALNGDVIKTATYQNAVAECLSVLSRNMVKLSNFTFVQLVSLTRKHRLDSLNIEEVIVDVEKRSKTLIPKEVNILFDALTGVLSKSLI
jgi:hypothetical protein